MPRGARRFVPPLLIALAVLTAYHATLTAPFLFDDTSIPETDTLHALSWRTVAGTTRPLVQLSLALNWAVGGRSVVGYHVVNLVVHLLAALTLWAIAARTLRRPGDGMALVIALVWAVHPLQTESVTYVVQRAESLMGLCYLLTLYCVIRGAATPRPAVWYGAAVAACALGMLCKPVMVTAPLVVLLYDRAFLAGSWTRAWRARRGLYLGLFATWAILVVLLAGQEHESGATSGYAMRDVTFAEFARSQPGVVLRYLQLVVWPHGLVLDYAWPPAEGFVGVVLPTLVLAGGLAAALFAVRDRPRLAFLVVAFVLVLAPSSSVLPIRDLAFEHRMYLPLAPLVALLAAGGWVLVERLRLPAPRARRMATAAAAVIVVALTALTVLRNRDYRSAVVMWSDVVAKRPANSRAHSNLSQALLQDQRVDDGIAAARSALELDPSRADAHVHLSRAAAMRGKYAEAEKHAAEAARLDAKSADAQNNWGVALADQKRYAEAEPHYREALRLRAAYPEAKNNLGVALMQRGAYDEAAALYRDALRDIPEYVEPYSNLGNLLLRQGKHRDAVVEYRRALALRPSSAEVRFNLALGLNEIGQRDEALAQAAEALRLRPDLAPLVRQAGLGGGA